MTEFNVQTILDVLTQTFFGGDSSIAGIGLLIGVFLLLVVIFSRIGAPIPYTLIPMIPVTLFFTYLGIVDATVSMLIIVITVVIVAMFARNVVEGGV